MGRRKGCGRGGDGIGVATRAVSVVESMMLRFGVDGLGTGWLRNRMCEMKGVTSRRGLVRVYGLSAACASVSVRRRAAMRSCPEAETICVI